MRFLLGVICFFLLFSNVAKAEMVTVAVYSANLRDAPVVGGPTIKLKAPLYYPLRVLAQKEEVLKVEDFQGRTGWISKAEVENVKGVVVNRPMVNIRLEPGLNSKVLFKAARGVCFKVLTEQGKWLQVRHESGKTGWLYKELVWGGV